MGRALIAAANEAGGRDNITVVLFRLEEVRVGAGGSDAELTTEQAAVEEYEDYDAGPATREVPTAAPSASAAQEAEYRSSATVAVAAVRPAPARSELPRRTAPLPPRRDREGRDAPGQGGRSAGRRPPPPKRGLRRFAAPLIVISVLLALILVSAWIAIRGVFFVGLDDHRAVTIYRGLPYELPLGVKLYTRDYTSGVTIEQVPSDRRTTFTNHKLRSNSDAQDLVRQLEVGKVR
jgi:PPM family protein phosphatase